MSADWLAIEIDLPDHPKVRSIARTLGVSNYAVVGMLVRIWGWFDRESSDGFVTQCVTHDIDDLTRCDGFANALLAVGWLVIDPARGLGVPAFESHHGNSAKKRLQTAARVNRFRERKRSNASNAITETKSNADVTQEVTPTEQNSTYKKKDQKKEHASPIGSRLPENFPSPAELSWARTERPEVDADLELKKFRDHWLSKAGKDGRKADWPATWRNWIRNSRGTDANRSTSRKLSVVEQIEQNIADRKQREAAEAVAIVA
jgi:hypothetical protein